MRPHGIDRTFNPRKWERGTRLLVGGELLAFAAAVVGAALPDKDWLLATAAISGAGALFFYALGKSSLGEMPLTATSARRIRAVVGLAKTEEQVGPIFDWDSITGDGTVTVTDWSEMKPEVKTDLGKALMGAALRAQHPETPAHVMDQILREIPESVYLEHAESVLDNSDTTTRIYRDPE